MTTPTHWRTVPKFQNPMSGAIFCDAMNCWLQPCEPPVETAGKEVWRLLEIGEAILIGDEYITLANLTWEKVYRPGDTVSATHLPIRRRETIPVAGWPPPRYDDPAKCGRPGRNILVYFRGMWMQGCAGGWKCVPWMEQPPPAPEPPKSEAELAYEIHQTETWLHKGSFIYAYEAALKAKGGA